MLSTRGAAVRSPERTSRFLISSSIVRWYSVFGGVAGTSAVTCGAGGAGSLDFASNALSLTSTRSSCCRRLITCAFSWSISDSCAEAPVQLESSKNAKATVPRMTVLRWVTKNATRADTRGHTHVDTLRLGSKGTSSGWMLVAGDCRKMNAMGGPSGLLLTGWVFSSHSRRDSGIYSRGGGSCMPLSPHSG